MGDDVITIKKNCRICGEPMKIEKCSENGFRWKNIFCPSYCFVISTEKKPIKKSNVFAEYRHEGKKMFLRTQNEDWHEVELIHVKKGMQVKAVKN